MTTTVKLDSSDIKRAIDEYVARETGAPVKSVALAVHPGQGEVNPATVSATVELEAGTPEPPAGPVYRPIEMYKGRRR